jgi:hypothetical protein
MLQKRLKGGSVCFGDVMLGGRLRDLIGILRGLRDVPVELSIAVEFAGAIQKRLALMYGATGAKPLPAWAG